MVLYKSDKRLCQNADTIFFYARSLDFLNHGLCHLLWHGVVCNKFVHEASREFIDRLVSGVFSIWHTFLTFVVDCFYDDPFAQQEPIVQAHEWVFHVLLQFRGRTCCIQPHAKEDVNEYRHH